MSDKQLGIKVERLVIHSGFEKSNCMFFPIIKIIQMRYKNVTKAQACRVTKSVLG